MIRNLTQENAVHLVLDDTALEMQLASILKKFTKNIKSFDNVDAFLSEPLSDAPSCLIIELALTNIDGISLIKRMRNHGLSIPIIVIASKNDGVYSAVQAIRAGAADFIEQPIVERDFIERINSVIKKSKSNSVHH